MLYRSTRRPLDTWNPRQEYDRPPPGPAAAPSRIRRRLVLALVLAALGLALGLAGCKGADTVEGRVGFQPEVGRGAKVAETIKVDATRTDSPEYKPVDLRVGGPRADSPEYKPVEISGSAWPSVVIVAILTTPYTLAALAAVIYALRTKNLNQLAETLVRRLDK